MGTAIVHREMDFIFNFAKYSRKAVIAAFLPLAVYLVVAVCFRSIVVAAVIACLAGISFRESHSEEFSLDVIGDFFMCFMASLLVGSFFYAASHLLDHFFKEVTFWGPVSFMLVFCGIWAMDRHFKEHSTDQRGFDEVLGTFMVAQATMLFWLWVRWLGHI